MEEVSDMENITTKEQEFNVVQHIIRAHHDYLDQLVEKHDQQVRKLENDLIDVRDHLSGYLEHEDSFVASLLKEAKKHLQRILDLMNEEHDTCARKGIDTMSDGWYDYHGELRGSLGEIYDILDHIED